MSNETMSIEVAQATIELINELVAQRARLMIDPYSTLKAADSFLPLIAHQVERLAAYGYEARQIETTGQYELGDWQVMARDYDNLETWE